MDRRCCCAASTCERFLCLLPCDLLANQRHGEANSGSREQSACTLRVRAKARNPLPARRTDRDITKAAWEEESRNREQRENEGQQNAQKAAGQSGRHCGRIYGWVDRGWRERRILQLTRTSTLPPEERIARKPFKLRNERRRTAAQCVCMSDLPRCSCEIGLSAARLTASTLLTAAEDKQQERRKTSGVSGRAQVGWLECGCGEH